MKKLSILVGVIGLFALSSCKKCAECTFQDPERGELKNEEVCQKGKQYKHVLEIYERNQWVCVEK